MTQEEAIERIKSRYDKWALDDKDLEAIQCIFPELRESEDERIRKFITETVFYVYGESQEYKDVVAWLEKQKEAKDFGELMNKLTATEQQTMFDAWEYDKQKALEKQKEQKPERINITDMVAKYRATDEYVEGEYKGKPVNCMIRAYEQGIRDTLLRVKEQKPAESTALHKAFISSKIDYALEEKFDASDYADAILPTSVACGENDEEYKLHKIIEAAFIAGQKKEQKPAEWSDEDERMLSRCIKSVECSKKQNKNIITMKANELFPGALARVNRDGLCIKKDTIVEVRAVDADDKLIEKRLIGSAHCRPLDDNQFEGGIWCEYLDPIPLTPEILEKNFEKKTFYGIYDDYFDLYIREYSDSLYIVTYHSCEFNIPDQTIHVSWVHELQHFMRHCGIEKEIVL